MDNKKFEKLMDLIINENEEQARELFHDIVVDASREIYESIMEEEMMDESMHGDDMDEGMGGQVGDLLDEISAEEEGMMEDEEDDLAMDDEMDMADADDSFDLDADEMEGDADGEEVEDAVIRIEDKLDQLMREFESIMGGDDDMADDDEVMEADVEEDSEEVMEAVQLQKVSVTHGDNGVQTKSTVAANSGQRGMASKPVAASTTTETGRAAPTTKDLKGAGSFKNAPGQKKQDLSAAPKPVTKDGSSNDRSPVAK
jgi:hypothetical protein